MKAKREQILNGISEEIKEILYGYIKAESFTHSEKEKDAEKFFLNYFSGQEYFQKHPELFGRKAIQNDPLGRAAVFAMVKGEGPETVVFVHHNDVVTIEDFKLLAPFAFSPEKLEEGLLEMSDTLAEEAAEDLLSKEWLFGRGVCDMKGGGAIQMAMLSRYAKLPEFRGNLIVLGVPDEENLSAGMREAVVLLAELKEKYGLDYRLMINSEPHQRRDPKKGVFSTGSVGKIMPFIYVRGSLAHAGKVFEGFNPLNLMAEIMRRTELSMDFSDRVGNEAAPPPTWLYCRDCKENYDVSMPLSVAGCFSILTLNQTPAGVLKKVRKVCEDAFDRILKDMQEAFDIFQEHTAREQQPLPWVKKVTEFSQLYKEAEAAHGEVFRREYENEKRRVKKEFDEGKLSLIESNFALVDFIYNYVDDLSPRVVFGLTPPYYPNVSNVLLPDLSPEIRGLDKALNTFTQDTFGQSYESEAFYTGISDLSYTSIGDSEEAEGTLASSMPLFGSFYSLPVAEIDKISMPCMNIGPWGKDFHKLTERVYKEDLYERTPMIIQRALEIVLKEQ